MSKNLDDNNIYKILYEEIPSDGSEISCGESDNDEDYCLPSRDVVISESSDTSSDYDDSEILNLDDNNVYLLPSPLKKLDYQLKEKILLEMFKFQTKYQLVVVNFFLILILRKVICQGFSY